MNLHEYQSKQLFAHYGMPVPRGKVAATPDAAVKAAEELGGKLWVVKAQVHAGGRGKAGGVTLCRTTDEVREAAKKMIGMTLVTHQTGPEGLPVGELLIEAGSDISRELYLSVVVDRETERVTFMASTEGGMDIETVAHDSPEKIETITIDPATGLMPYHGRAVAAALKLEGDLAKQAANVLAKLYDAFLGTDASQIEINPLA
ncbi:MAG: acetate--CoA ligase family protein, partial [Proteobacteria bacterium]|nr:acetate--CoA ligase family protein [Pseudomonadota bacterium]